MPVAASSILTLPGDALRTTLSQCSAFQTFTSTADATAALAKIYLIARPSATAAVEQGDESDDGWARPYALISLPRSVRIFRGGYTNGRLMLLLEKSVNSVTYNATDPDATMAFANEVGNVVKELAVALDGDGTLVIPRTGISMDIEISRSEVDDDDYHQAIVNIDYGVGLES